MTHPLFSSPTRLTLGEEERKNLSTARRDLFLAQLLSDVMEP
jgi:hypothetical protein